ncbi:MAG: hypothetical protein ABJ004_07505 [Cyclobacteriaceae bacterium]
MRKEQTAFCTIVTLDHLDMARATMESIRTTADHPEAYDFHILVVDRDYMESHSGQFYSLMGYANLDLGEFRNQVEVKKETGLRTSLRWLLKPFLLKHLLTDYRRAFWVDPDLYFYNDFSSIVRLLDNHPFVLSPQWKCFDPRVNPQDFPRNFYHGLFNGGFFGSSSEGIAILNQWINMMLWRLEQNRALGLFDDQGYMGLFNLIDEKTHFIKHRGINLASWNRYECKRGSDKNGEVRINGEYEVVFIHFTKDTIKYILNGEDKLLRPHLKQYLDHILRHDPDLKELKSHKVKKIERKLASY